MARFSYSATTVTPEAVADTTNMTDAKHMSIQGAAAPFTWNVIEIQLGGQATTSTVDILLMARHSTIGATLSNGSGLMVAALHPSSVAAARATGYNTATTKPQRSSTLHLLSLSFNTFGGIVRWVAAPGEELTGVGATASFGEMGLSGFTGSGLGAFGGHIIWDEA